VKAIDYIKGGTIFILFLVALGGFGSVDLGIGTIGQALEQTAVCAVLAYLVAHLEGVLCIVYYVLHGLYKAASRLPRNVRNVHRSS
jgi:hypothetical protein